MPRSGRKKLCECGEPRYEGRYTCEGCAGLPARLVLHERDDELVVSRGAKGPRVTLSGAELELLMMWTQGIGLDLWVTPEGVLRDRRYKYMYTTASYGNGVQHDMSPWEVLTTDHEGDLMELIWYCPVRQPTSCYDAAGHISRFGGGYNWDVDRHELS